MSWRIRVPNFMQFGWTVFELLSSDTMLKCIVSRIFQCDRFHTIFKSPNYHFIENKMCSIFATVKD